ncbi:MAG: 4Fe-4S binding protein [Desulfarculales bacterium]|jgi:epoxyqueuosine reductase QueG|nr:4Fe-4S binding protein [Desulfarculales bacterium]
MTGISGQIKAGLLAHGADIVGFADLGELPPDVRQGLPVGICVAVKYPPQVIRGIAELPTREYCDWYHKLNHRLDNLVIWGAGFLQNQGFRAVANTIERVSLDATEYNTALPHKTVATRAGIGWIGKSALLVTEKYGSMIRLSSVLTNAPLDTASPVNESRCGKCTVCANACPAGAISGKLWEVGLYRDEFFDPVKCGAAALERARRGFGGEVIICGKCIEICPYTRRSWRNSSGQPSAA